MSPPPAGPRAPRPRRERLAAEQAALVRALVGGGPVPGGFDPGRVRATSAATLAAPPRRLVVTVRLPGLGDRWFSLPLSLPGA